MVGGEIVKGKEGGGRKEFVFKKCKVNYSTSEKEREKERENNYKVDIVQEAGREAQNYKKTVRRDR